MAYLLPGPCVSGDLVSEHFANGTLQSESLINELKGCKATLSLSGGRCARFVKCLQPYLDCTSPRGLCSLVPGKALSSLTELQTKGKECAGASLPL